MIRLKGVMRLLKGKDTGEDTRFCCARGGVPVYLWGARNGIWGGSGGAMERLMTAQGGDGVITAVDRGRGSWGQRAARR